MLGPGSRACTAKLGNVPSDGLEAWWIIGPALDSATACVCRAAARDITSGAVGGTSESCCAVRTSAESGAVVGGTSESCCFDTDDEQFVITPRSPSSTAGKVLFDAIDLVFSDLVRVLNFLAVGGLAQFTKATCSLDATPRVPLVWTTSELRPRREADGAVAVVGGFIALGLMEAALGIAPGPISAGRTHESIGGIKATVACDVSATLQGNATEHCRTGVPTSVNWFLEPSSTETSSTAGGKCVHGVAGVILP